MSIIPKVSVILPTYNAAEYLGSSIGSVLAQSFEDLELLVLDNASSDSTAEIVAAFSDRRLRYRPNPTNLGFSRNVELGRSLAVAPYVAIQNADDQWERDHLSKAIDRLDADPRLAFTHGRVTTVDAAGRPFGESAGRWEPVTAGRDAFVKVFLAGFSFPTMVIRNEALRAVPALPANEVWGKIADSWLFLRLCLHGHVGFVSDSVVRYRVHRTSLMFESYADGSFFCDRLSTVRDAFTWPEIKGSISPRDQRRIIQRVARDALAVLPAIRDGAGRPRLLRAFAGVAGEVPSVLLYPEIWARLAFGLLPQPTIARLRERKRRRWIARHQLFA